MGHFNIFKLIKKNSRVVYSAKWSKKFECYINILGGWGGPCVPLLYFKIVQFVIC